MSRPKQFNKTDSLAVVVQHAAQVGYQSMTRASIAVALGCSEAQVSVLFGTMIRLRRSVVRAAIMAQNLKVIGQAVAADDTHVQNAPEALRKAAVQAML